MSKETEILHRISQARNQHNAPGTDELLKDCDIFIKEYGDLVDSYCTGKVEEMQLQIADMATKLTVAEDETASHALKLKAVEDECKARYAQTVEKETELVNVKDELLSIKATSLILPPGVKLEDAMKILNASKPKRTRRTKKEMAEARAKEQSAKNARNRDSQPLH